MAEVKSEKPPMPVNGSEDTHQPLNEKLEDTTVASPPSAVENLVTRDGFRLHPQPTTDPLDPLNWSSFQKHTILAIVMFKYCSSNVPF